MIGRALLECGMTFVMNLAVSIDMLGPAVPGKLKAFAARTTRHASAPAPFGVQRGGNSMHRLFNHDIPHPPYGCSGAFLRATDQRTA